MIAGRWTILCLIVCLSACSTTEPVVITESESREVVRNQYVSVPENLTEPVEIVYPARPDTNTLDIIVAYKLQREQARVCNAKLAEIAGLKMEESNE